MKRVKVIIAKGMQLPIAEMRRINSFSVSFKKIVFAT